MFSKLTKKNSRKPDVHVEQVLQISDTHFIALQYDRNACLSNALELHHTKQGLESTLVIPKRYSKILRVAFLEKSKQLIAATENIIVCFEWRKDRFQFTSAHPLEDKKIKGLLAHPDGEHFLINNNSHATIARLVNETVEIVSEAKCPALETWFSASFKWSADGRCLMGTWNHSGLVAAFDTANLKQPILHKKFEKDKSFGQCILIMPDGVHGLFYRWYQFDKKDDRSLQLVDFASDQPKVICQLPNPKQYGYRKAFVLGKDKIGLIQIQPGGKHFFETWDVAKLESPKLLSTVALPKYLYDSFELLQDGTLLVTGKNLNSDSFIRQIDISKGNGVKQEEKQVVLGRH